MIKVIRYVLTSSDIEIDLNILFVNLLQGEIVSELPSGAN